MNHSTVQLLDLPNEILFHIVKFLDNVDVLYSLFDIQNKRIDSIVQEETFSCTLDFSSTIHERTRLKSILDRFCNHILSRVRYNVKCLSMEIEFMERILLIGPYPQLTTIKLLNFRDETSMHYFTDDSSLANISKKQITTLDLNTKDCRYQRKSAKEYANRVYAHILDFCENLQHLSVVESSMYLCPGLSLRFLPATSFSSSTLTYLRINVINFIDCLCLLDGRLEQLNTLIIQVYSLKADLSTEPKDPLPKLKHFSFLHDSTIEEYDDRIVSLVRRMINLETLNLYLRIRSTNLFIDPIYLLNQFSMDIPKLHSFSFYLSIRLNQKALTCCLPNNQFEQKNIKAVHSPVSNMISRCSSTAIFHTFTIPFEFTTLMDLGNVFPNIVFKYVTELWLKDDVPFRQEFFLRIAQSFPLLRKLMVSDFSPEFYDRKPSELSNDVKSYEIVEYPNLVVLDLIRSGMTLIDQFLNESKTRLSRLTKLYVFYEMLRKVTNDFTREETRRNCSHIARLVT